MDPIEKNLRGLRKFLSQATGVLFAWIVAAAVLQKGPISGYLWAAGWFMLLGYLWLVGFYALAAPRRALATGAVGGFLLAWLGLAQSFRTPAVLLADSLLILAAGLLVWLVERRRARRRSPDREAEAGKAPFQPGPYLTAVAGAWLLISFADRWIRPPLAVDPGRFEVRVAGDVELIPHGIEWPPRRLGLALSGGGYRAALLHAGVVQGLERLGIRPTHLSSVSGGSIFAAHYWSGGAPEAFKEAVARGRFNLRRELFLLPRALQLVWPMRLPGSELQLLPGPDYNRLDAQAALLERQVLGGIRDPVRRSAAQPRWMIDATDLAFGTLVGLTEEGLLVVGPDLREFYREGVSLDLGGPLPLGRRVAISGAFPGAFPTAPFAIEIAPLSGKDKDPGRRFPRRLALTDGGVGDNSGYRLLRAASEQACEEVRQGLAEAPASLGAEWCLDVLMASDGGAVFAVEPEVGGVQVVSRVFDVGGRIARPGPARDDRPDVELSPQRRFLPVDRTFVGPWDPATRLESGRSVQSTPFDPHLFPQVLLEALQSLLPPRPRTDFAEQLQAFLAASDFHRTHPPEKTPAKPPPGLEPPSHFLSVETCRQREGTQGPRGRIGPSTCPAVALRLTLLDQIRQDLETFAATSTLRDQLPRHQTESIFRLGQTLVFLQWHALLRTLGPPGAAPRPRPPAVPPAPQAAETPPPP